MPRCVEGKSKFHEQAIEDFDGVDDDPVRCLDPEGSPLPPQWRRSEAISRCRAAAPDRES